MARSIADIRKLLQADGLAEAEKMTDLSYKEDPTTMALGFGIHLDLVQLKRIALEEIGDTHFNQTLDEHLSIWFKLGFQVIHEEDFTDEKYGYQEKLFILWHVEKGILGFIESYNGTRVNNSKIWYNVQLKNRDDYNWSFTSSHSGLGEDLVLAGMHDVREGLLVAIDGLEQMGTFLPVWKKPYWYSLLTYTEWRVPDVDSKAITTYRVNMLPPEVQEAIKGN